VTYVDENYIFLYKEIKKPFLCHLFVCNIFTPTLRQLWQKFEQVGALTNRKSKPNPRAAGPRGELGKHLRMKDARHSTNYSILTVRTILSDTTVYCSIGAIIGVVVRDELNTSLHRVGKVLSFSPVVGIGTPPTPHPHASVPPPPLVPGGGVHSLAIEGVGESQFRRVDIHCGTLYIYVLCASLHSAKSRQ
jgi:hypothetical protein